MAKVKFDVSGVESTGGDVIKAGVYPAAITEMEYGKSSNGNNMFTIVFTVKGGEYDGRKLWHYILPESAEFRLREFTDALEIEPKGTIDTVALIGTVLQVRTIVRKSEEYGEQAKIKNVLPGVESAAEDDEDLPYAEWETSELADEVTARELKLSPGRKTKAKLIAALEADDEANGDDETEEEGEDEEDAEEEEGDGDELTRADLAEMDRATLKALIKEDELEVKVLKKDTDDDLREKIAAVLELPEADDEEAEEEEAEDDVDYATWEIADLKAELKERGLKPDGRKSILAARLAKDDESSTGKDPF